MKLIVLIAFFSTAEAPAPHIIEAQPIRFMSTFDQCIKTRDFREKYWEVPEGVLVFHVCVTIEVMGYEEAIDAFNRRIGDLL